MVQPITTNKMYFLKHIKNIDIVNSEFEEKLKQKYENLTRNDLRLCAYLKVGLNNKAIAQITNTEQLLLKRH